jgi:hypothetical protein
MLSATNTITDMKIELQTYDVYGYSTDNLFVTALTEAVATARRERMIPIMGEGDYTALTALDKTGLTEDQTNIYYAEIYYSIAEYVLSQDRKDKFMRRGTTESRSGANNSYSITSGFSGKNAVASEYISKGDACISAGGYDSGKRLIPRTSIHAY